MTTCGRGQGARPTWGGLTLSMFPGHERAHATRCRRQVKHDSDALGDGGEPPRVLRERKGASPVRRLLDAGRRDKVSWHRRGPPWRTRTATSSSGASVEL